MTIEAVRPSASVQKQLSVVWVPVAAGLWAGSTDGNFVGLIEKVADSGFTARDGRSANLGLFGNLTDAKRAVERQLR
ncbi:hypothetical protein IWX78_003085 [Mycetocola sp. CAN_C7]|uniref:hypothetical protein n=1 Tax=Mycetocola sp. CAN_C7 TaxID=2787724 RepID=UPI0018CAE597